MKNILFIALLLFFYQFSFAQDTIVKNSGEMIPARIIEISPTQIKYKKMDFLDGPLYVENKSDVKMIKYSNGTKEEFTKDQPKTTPKTTTATTTGTDDYYGGTATASVNKIDIWGSHYKTQGKTINEKSMQKLLLESKDKQIVSLVGQAKDAHKMQYIGFAAIPLGMISLVALANSRPYNPTTKTYGARNNSIATLSAICFVGTIACPVISSIEKHKRKNCNHAAIKIYNEKF
jgi:hypothetical protein